MIALSSFKPFDKCTAEIIGNQVKANMSWQNCFDSISYYNYGYQSWFPRLNLCIVSVEAPSIKEMARRAAIAKNWTAILNADIILGSAKFKLVTAELFRQNGTCAMSRRLEFDPRNPTVPAKVVDLGMDFFCATPEVWVHVAREIPEGFRLGANQWDTWLLGFLNSNYGDGFYDLTKVGFCFHPKHEDRKRTSDFAMNETDWKFSQSYLHMPNKQIII